MAGLTLVGFLEHERPAIDYLRKRCFPGAFDGALIKRWKDAKARLGNRWLDVGAPKIEPIPPEYSEYIEKVKNHPRFHEPIGGMPCDIVQVEIDPLVAFQYDVDLDRAASACEGLSQNPSLGDMLKRCLPIDLEKVDIFPSPAPDENGVLITSDNPNMRPLDASCGQDADGLFTVTVKIGARSPFIQVVKLGDRCYLKNGYHRAYGLRKLNATKMPCLFLTATHIHQAGVLPGATIPEYLLYRDNAPTLGHYSQDRATAVPLHKFHRTFHVGWTQIY